MVRFTLTGRSAGVKQLWTIRFRGFHPTTPNETVFLGQDASEDLDGLLLRMAKRIRQQDQLVDLSLEPDEAAGLTVLMVATRKASSTE